MNKQNKDKTIAVRFTEKEYKYIKSQVKKSGVTMSDYIRDIVLHDRKKEKDETSICTVIKIAAQAKEISNYIFEKYGEDENLEGKVKRLWKSLS